VASRRSAVRRVTVQTDSVDRPACGLPQVQVTSTRQLPPAPRIVEALTNIGYSFEAAISDLVDNSIDARARNVLIRFFVDDEQVRSLVVVDDGCGITPERIDEVMRFGSDRSYQEGDLGMFGTGLKSASLSQAGVLSIFSRARRKQPVGCQWTRTGAAIDWTVGDLEDRSVAELLGREWDDRISLDQSGTVVRWDEVSDFEKARGQVSEYTNDVFKRLTQHLGLHFHRFLGGAQGTAVRILIDAERLADGKRGFPTEVKPIDPFGYPKPGASGFPKDFRVEMQGVDPFHVTGHIWPKGSKLSEYKLPGKGAANAQGLYFYRHDRLIQAGGWDGFRTDAEPHCSLARVVVDLDGKDSVFSVRFSKSGVDVPASFINSLRSAKSSDGTEFSAFIDQAQRVYRTRSKSKPKPILRPGSGFGNPVKDALEESFVTNGRAVSIVWESLPLDQFFEMKPDDHRLVLNKRYRNAVLQGRRGSAADAPLVKSLLFLLVNELFRSRRQSAAQRELLDGYQAVLVAAARSQV
jgi:hypothetical protein